MVILLLRFTIKTVVVTLIKYFAQLICQPLCKLNEGLISLWSVRSFHEESGGPPLSSPKPRDGGLLERYLLPAMM